MTTRLLRWFLSLSVLAMPLGAQEEDEEKAPPSDPYTRGEPEAMAAAGYVSFGPFTFGEFRGTREMDQVLGEGKVLWVETAHFKIGSSLSTISVPADRTARKAVVEELKELKKKLPRVNPRAKKLDRWLRLHLYAHRMEALYADFCQRIGVTDEDFTDSDKLGKGKYLGQPGKYLLMMSQKRSTHQRYLERFVGRRDESSESVRQNFMKSNNLLVAVCAESHDGSLSNDIAMHCHVVFNMVHNLMDGYHGYWYQLPIWWYEGLSHWYARKVHPEYINLTMRDDDTVDLKTAWQWPRKVRARAGFDHFPKAAELLPLFDLKDLDFNAHMNVWSRVDYLLTLGDDKVALFMKSMTTIPVPQDGVGVRPEQVLRRQERALKEVWDLDPEKFDRDWKRFVLKTYPKK